MNTVNGVNVIACGDELLQLGTYCTNPSRYDGRQCSLNLDFQHDLDDSDWREVRIVIGTEQKGN